MARGGLGYLLPLLPRQMAQNRRTMTTERNGILLIAPQIFLPPLLVPAQPTPNLPLIIEQIVN